MNRNSWLARHGMRPAVGKLLPALALAALSGASPTFARGQGSSPISRTTQSMYEPVRTNILRSMDAIPDRLYSYRPSADVRTVAAQFAHIANAQFAICSGSLGEANPQPRSLEDTTFAPSDLKTRVRQAFALCDRAYAQLQDSGLSGAVDFFGGKQPRHYALTYNVIHANEHYGNLVTYMRINGIVPPSSAPPAPGTR